MVKPTDARKCEDPASAWRLDGARDGRVARHLHRVVAEYIRYFNAARPHQGLRQQTPVPAVRPSDGKIVRLPVLGGLHHDYRRAA